MRAGLRSASLLALLLSGCGGTLLVPRTVSTSIPAIQPALETAVAAWQTVGAPLELGDEGILVSFGDFTIRERLGRMDSMCGSRLELASDLRPERYVTVLEHELGHALGLEHTASGVMAPVAGTVVPAPSEDDVARIVPCWD